MSEKLLDLIPENLRPLLIEEVKELLEAQKNKKEKEIEKDIEKRLDQWANKNNIKK